MAEFCMPSLGADMAAGTLVAWRGKPGDRLRRGDIIAEVETDKGIVEVEVYAEGVLERYLVEPGAKVPVGTPLAVLSEGERAPAAIAAAVQDVAVPAAPPATAPAPQPSPAAAAAVPARSVEAAGAAREPISAPPSVRRRARELGVDLMRIAAARPVPTRDEVERAAVAARSPAPAAGRARISPAARRRAQALGLDPSSLRGSGPAGAITLQDVEAASARAAPPVAAAPAARPAAAVQGDRNRAMRRAIAAAMARSKREIPHYYVGTTIDLGTASAWLAARNAERSVRERLLPAVLLLKATARAARSMPEFNAYFEGDAVRMLEDVHLGVAISLRGGGLVAPAIHNADRLALDELMAKLQDLVTRARAGTLRSSELSDGTITVTNLGDRGVETVFPIIYPPQTAIVAFGRIAERPWVTGGALAVRPVVNAALAADHRVSDGHLGARFLALVDQLLQEPDRL
jgi:pyruvate dehydrogenase E2 component (dihydrolipoamide acetyltransferase)